LYVRPPAEVLSLKCRIKSNRLGRFDYEAQTSKHVARGLAQSYICYSNLDMFDILCIFHLSKGIVALETFNQSSYPVVRHNSYPFAVARECVHACILGCVCPCTALHPSRMIVRHPGAIAPRYDGLWFRPSMSADSVEAPDSRRRCGFQAS